MQNHVSPCRLQLLIQLRPYLYLSLLHLLLFLYPVHHSAFSRHFLQCHSCHLPISSVAHFPQHSLSFFALFWLFPLFTCFLTLLPFILWFNVLIYLPPHRPPKGLDVRKQDLLVRCCILNISCKCFHACLSQNRIQTALFFKCHAHYPLLCKITDVIFQSLTIQRYVSSPCTDLQRWSTNVLSQPNLFLWKHVRSKSKLWTKCSILEVQSKHLLFKWPLKDLVLWMSHAWRRQPYKENLPSMMSQRAAIRKKKKRRQSNHSPHLKTKQFVHRMLQYSRFTLFFWPLVTFRLIIHHENTTENRTIFYIELW